MDEAIKCEVRHKSRIFSHHNSNGKQNKTVYIVLKYVSLKVRVFYVNLERENKIKFTNSCTRVSYTR